MDACSQCSRVLQPSEVLVGPAGPICADCHLGGDADAMMTSGLRKQAWLAIAVGVTGLGFRLEINGFNLVPLVLGPVGAVMALRAIVLARKHGDNRALAIGLAGMVLSLLAAARAAMGLIG